MKERASHLDAVSDEADELAQRLRAKCIELENLIGEAEAFASANCNVDGYFDASAATTGAMCARMSVVAAKDAALKIVFGNRVDTVQSRKEYRDNAKG